MIYELTSAIDSIRLSIAINKQAQDRVIDTPHQKIHENLCDALDYLEECLEQYTN